MQFSEYYDQIKHRNLTQADAAHAADLLGMSDRCAFRRYNQRFEADGEDGLLDGRIATAAHNRIPVDKRDMVVALFEDHYSDVTCKPFPEKLVKDHAFKHSDNWVRIMLVKSVTIDGKEAKKGRKRNG